MTRCVCTRGHLVVDLPHVWNEWSSYAARNADDVVVVATPQLASLRNAKNMIDFLSESRPNDRAPLLILNKIGEAKGHEIEAEDFGDAIESEVHAVIPYDPVAFAQAANTGEMVFQHAPSSESAAAILKITHSLAGPKPVRRMRKEKPSGSLLERLFGSLLRGRLGKEEGSSAKSAASAEDGGDKKEGG